MRKHKAHTNPGSTPGTLEYNGKQSAIKTRIHVIDYTENGYMEKDLENPEDVLAYKTGNSISWIELDGVNELEVIEKMGHLFDLHPVLMEDIVNTEQRPKLEDYNHYIFLVLKMLWYDKNNHKIESEHVSFVMGKGYVITFQDGHKGDVFDPVRERIRNNKGRICRTQSDYLLYALIDVLVDHYFAILECLGDRIEILEDEVMAHPSTATLRQIYRLKREIMYLRKCVWPIREVVNGLQRSESGLVTESIKIYFRDVYDHTIQIMDAVEYYRDLLAGMVDIYLSSLSYRMNAIMKVLTIIATIFIPLTFITSIYGMNFEFMPELKWHYGYLMIWGVMLTVTGVMFVYFRKKKWF